MRNALHLLAAPLLAVATHAAAADYATLRGSAEHLDALEPFLSRFVGRCGDGFDRRTCEENAAAARKKLVGKAYAVRIPDAASLVQARVRDGRFVLLVTPFFDGGGLALTQGAPKRQDAEGRPLVPLLAIEGDVPDGTMDLEFQGPFRTGAIELELVFRPEKPWKLARKNEPGSYEGVAVRILAVRVVNARTGDVIATKLL